MTDYIRNRVQLYSENTSIKYPLEDTNEELVPYDMIVDMSITLKDSEGPVYITNIVCTEAYAFVSLENDTLPIANAMVIGAVPFRINQMTAMTEYCNGWVVFGPGVTRPFSIKGVRIPVDRRCIMPARELPRKFKLKVNGMEYDMPDMLNITSSWMVSQTIETRALGQSLVLRRDDTKISQVTLKNELTDIDLNSIPLATINGIKPDSEGNINLTVTAENPAETALLTDMKAQDNTQLGGLIRTTSVAGCEDPDISLMKDIKKSDTGEGVPYVLPLDCIFDGTCPEEY